jgi:transposase
MACRPLFDQFAALLPPRETYVPTHPWGCHRRRIDDRIVFDKLIQVLRFGCSYQAIADTTCSATTIRNRRDEWIALGVFTTLAQIARDAYDRIVGLALDDVAVDGCITKAPGGGECAGPSPVDRRKQGMKRSVLVDGHGIPLGRVLAGANRHDSPLLDPTLDRLDDLAPAPGRDHRAPGRGLRLGQDPQPVGRTRPARRDRAQGREGPNPGHQALACRADECLAQRVQPFHRCYERREVVIDAFFDLADAVITVRRLIRQAWTTHRWDTRPTRRP